MATGQVNMSRIQKVVQGFSATISAIKAQIARLTELGLNVPSRALEAICVGNTVTENVTKDGVETANLGRMTFLSNKAMEVLTKMTGLELVYLRSEFYQTALRTRINALHKAVYGQYWGEIENHFDSLRKGTSLGSCRDSEKNLLAVLATAEAAPIPANFINSVLNPSKPKPKPVRQKKQQGATTVGIKGQKPNDHGGWGSSKKVRAKKNKRARSSKAA